MQDDKYEREFLGEGGSCCYWRTEKLREDIDFLVSVVRELSEEVASLRISISESQSRPTYGRER